ncbi:MAG TPA: VCBS repeat-containing protein [Candidatus Hydrogenedentes bacterium]|nr:VCBS repeat-containing protein [Candidatus Hydrogenedentota bacterium]HNT86853.1 VCBS repeat-containing protein [Candidatus Hydrogenedentota bacterium]
MIVVVLIPMLAALEFRAQDVPGLRVDAVHPLTAAASLNCVQADLDGDGAADLVFPREVAFQRGGGFPREARVSLPDSGEQAFLDVWRGELYLFFAEHLSVMRRRGDEWQSVLSQTIAWPATEAGVLPLRGPGRAAALRQRRLHDFDGDGVPEIVVTNPQGVHVFRHNGKQYVPAGLLEVLPQLALQPGQEARVWPPETRRLAFPPREMACRLLFDGQRLCVLARTDVSQTEVRYRQVNHTVQRTADGEFAVAPDLTEEWVSDNVPAYMQPCRLNTDGRVDFAGGYWDTVQGGVLPGPLYTARATLDGGASYAIRRARTFWPHCGFVDFDGDGNLDMVVESNDVLEGGAREAVLRYLTHSRIAHELRVYRQDRGAFAETPALTHRVVVQLDRPPVAGTPFFQRRHRAGLLNLSGDFNGDGYKDLVVQDRSDRLAVFLSRGFSLPESPDVLIPLEFDATFAVADVNLDGRSDVIVRATSADRAAEGSRVHFAMEGAP